MVALSTAGDVDRLATAIEEQVVVQRRSNQILSAVLDGLRLLLEETSTIGKLTLQLLEETKKDCAHRREEAEAQLLASRYHR